MRLGARALRNGLERSSSSARACACVPFRAALVRQRLRIRMHACPRAFVSVALDSCARTEVQDDKMDEGGGGSDGKQDAGASSGSASSPSSSSSSDAIARARSLFANRS